VIVSDEPEEQQDLQNLSRMMRQVFNESVVEDIKARTMLLTPLEAPEGHSKPKSKDVPE
jgi:hypothetical protein